MQYIVLDLEWNQSYPGMRGRTEEHLNGEIIQIGAVRLMSDGGIEDRYQQLILPQHYRHLNHRVSKLTGIKEALLRSEGKPFPQAADEFRDWCGEGAVFLTWGFDDIRILQENLMLYDMDIDWTENWYNVQMVFNAQTQTGASQKSLASALEFYEIQPEFPAHDALADAYHTALVCLRLDLERGITEYRASVKEHKDGAPSALPPGCLGREVFHGFSGKNDALGRLGGEENRCPVCGETMRHGKWVSQQARRYMTLCRCPQHGDYLMRVRLVPDEDGSLRASRMLYETSEDMVTRYRLLSQSRSRRRR